MRRQSLLEAAARVVLRDGAGHLTLEAVAAEAGVSKGGLLYHFRSKESLISGMVQHLVEDFESKLREELASEPEAPGRFLRAYVRATFAYEHQPLCMAAGLAAPLAEDPALLGPLARGFADWKKAADRDGLPRARADLIRLAVDGLWFTELFGFAPLSDQARKTLQRELLEMTR
ncbi:MAG: TetR family transcriptional regulator [Candidatus Eremiobacterota bacterium]